MKQTIKIPGKTFLFGEYIATQGGASLIVTSQPLFELKIEKNISCIDNPFHDKSPAGKFYKQYGKELKPYQFTFINPYSLGGLGASTAEFLGLYLFTQKLLELPQLKDQALIRLYQSLSSKKGVAPSGADLIAQRYHGINYLYPNKNIQHSHTWPFKELSLLLFHTKQKLATHEHLENLTLDLNLNLQPIADRAYNAFSTADPNGFIKAINNYNIALHQLNLVATHSQNILKNFKKLPEVLAAKGCGALGADVILLLCKPEHKNSLQQQITHQKFQVLACENQISKNGIIY